MDQAAQRYRLAMIDRVTKLCRDCQHDIDGRHVGTWCADCEVLGTTCGSTSRLETRAACREAAKVTR